jgi:hypothetical protein
LIAEHISRAGVCAELLEDVLSQRELVISESALVDEFASRLDTIVPKKDAYRLAHDLAQLSIQTAAMNKRARKSTLRSI